MRYVDIDQPEARQAWLQALRPVAPADRGAGAETSRQRPVVHSAQAGLLAAGRVLDVLAVATAGWLASLALGGTEHRPMAVAAVALLVPHLLDLAGLYRAGGPYCDRRAMLFALGVPAASVPLAGAGAVWLAGAPDWEWLAWWGAAAGLGCAAARVAWGRVIGRLSRWRQAARRVLVVGERDIAVEVLALMAGEGRGWALPVAILLDRETPPRQTLGGFIGSIDDAEMLVREAGVDDVVVALPWSDTRRVARCLEKLRPLAVDLHLFPEDPAPFCGARGLSLLAGVPMARLEIRPLAGWRATAKAIEDRLLGAVLLVLALPLLAAVAVAVKLDSPGPVLFRQKRCGYDNLPFVCLKFRSMTWAPEEREVRQATRGDARVTRVGKFLRRTSLDELPQLFNVLNGTMSLVGPRPHALSHHHHYARLIDDYRCRHRMKPGITGWAQIHGYRGETETVEQMRNRVVHDLWYIDHWNLWLDLAILARTPLACLKGANAY